MDTPERSSSSETVKEKARNLIQQIRKCPSPALLYLLKRRLLNTHASSKSFRNRIKHCERTKQLLSIHAPNIQIPSSGVQTTTTTTTPKHLYWLFPILVPEPDKISKDLLDHGYDIPRGTSQISCVTSFFASDSNACTSNSQTTSSSCPNAKKMMEQTLYLPVSMHKMDENDILRLVLTLKDVTSPSTSYLMTSKIMNTRDRICFNYSWAILFGIVAVSSTLTGFPIQLKLSSFAFICHICYLIVHRMIILSLSTIVLTSIFLYVLGFVGGSFYISSSNTFAKYCSLLRKRDLKIQIENESSTETKENVPSLKDSGAVMVHHDDGMDPNDVVGFTGTDLSRDSPRDVLLAIPPQHYMEFDVNTNQYTPRLYFTEGSGGVLGANAMMGHDILFDWENQRIGFAESDCNYDSIDESIEVGVGTADPDEHISLDCELSPPSIESSCIDNVKVSDCKGKNMVRMSP